MNFYDWWATLTTREQARMVKDDCAEAWQEGFKDGYEKGVSAFHDSVKIEREACAKVCDDQANEPECPERAKYCAAAIRMRSNA